MAEKSYLNYVPPNLRPLAQTGYQLLDNIIGFDDGYDTTGELLGRSLRDEPVATAKAIGQGVRDAAVAAYEDPKGTISAMGDEFATAFDLLNSPFPEDATREQVGQQLEAVNLLATVIPGYKGVQAGTKAVASGVDNAMYSQAQNFLYPEGFIPAPYVAPRSRMVVPSQDEYDVLPSEVLADQFELPMRDLYGELAGSRIVTPMGEEAREMIRPDGDADLDVVYTGDLPPDIGGTHIGNTITLNSVLPEDERQAVLQHELSHFDGYKSQLPPEEVGGNIPRMEEIRLEQISVLDDLMKDPDQSPDDIQRYKTLRKELAGLTPEEMYYQNPGEMLARMAAGDFYNVRKLGAFQFLNPRLSNHPYSTRIKDIVNSVRTGEPMYMRVPMDLNQARLFEDTGDSYDPLRPETNLSPDAPAFARGPMSQQEKLDLNPIKEFEDAEGFGSPFEYDDGDIPF